MPMLEVWNNIPAGSTLHVTLDPSTEFGLTGTHTVITGNGPVLRGDIKLNDFPLEIPVGGVDQHMIELKLLRIGVDRTVHVVARVEEPDGSTFQDEATDDISLTSANKVDSVTLIANG